MPVSLLVKMSTIKKKVEEMASLVLLLMRM